MKLAVVLLGLSSAGTVLAAKAPGPGRVIDVAPEISTLRLDAAKGAQSRKPSREPVAGPLIELREVVGADGTVSLECSAGHDHAIHRGREDSR